MTSNKSLLVVLAAIISQYLETNRRLVIPQFGALLIKEPQRKVVFSPLLTRDDGVLCNLIIDSGMSEIEASGAIDRLVFDIRYALDANESYLIEGVGRFVKDQTGAIQFTESLRKREEEAKEEEAKEETPIEVAATEEEETTKEKTTTNEEESLEKEPQIIEQVEKTSSKENKESEAQFSKSIFDPDPDLEGLSYGGKRGRFNFGRIKGLDLWMVIAVAVVIIAVCSILYGFLRSGAGNSLSSTYSEQQF